jgi:ATP-dependent DNA helicase PIF1
MQFVYLCAQKANCWRDCIDQTIQLTKIKRQTDNLFIGLLEEIRFGRCTPRTVSIFETNKHLVFTDQSIRPTRLCTHKDDVDFINTRELESLPHAKREFRAIDTDALGHENTPHLNKLLSALCPAREQLTLKPHAQVMLIKNLDVANSLVNGSRGTVVGFDAERNHLPIVRFMNGAEMTMKYDSWTYKVSASGTLVTRKQLPLQLAWAISIHKSQGMTLDCVEISLSRAFECGQAYVALSRAKSLQNLKIVDFDPSAIRAHETVLKFYDKLKRVASVNNKLNFDDDDA